VGLVALTRWLWLDPIVALLVAANIVWAGVGIMKRSVFGLMDPALDTAEVEAVKVVLAPYLSRGIMYHALRTRLAGSRKFVSLHVLVPGTWTVHEGHALCERIEADIRRTIPNVSVLTHLESLQDPASWDDLALDRETSAVPEDEARMAKGAAAK
jgi:divalent metal cation (Fe/Co/Zn/Cd) transporter